MEYDRYLSESEPDARSLLHKSDRNAEMLRAAFGNKIDDYMDWLAFRGFGPKKPYSRKFLQGVAPELQRSRAELGDDLDAIAGEP